MIEILLPFEILFEIMSYQTLNDKINVGLTCKQFYYLIFNEDEILHKSKLMREYQNEKKVN
jgi:hypothetical protein